MRKGRAGAEQPASLPVSVPVSLPTLLPVGEPLLSQPETSVRAHRLTPQVARTFLIGAGTSLFCHRRYR